MYHPDYVLKILEDFSASYVRATDLSLKILQRSLKDLYFLFQTSPHGWELFKYLVKLLNGNLMAGSPNDEIDDNSLRDIKMGFVIAAGGWLEARKDDICPETRKYLTNWFRSITIRTGRGDTP